jgi:hypothetical protein
VKSASRQKKLDILLKWRIHDFQLTCTTSLEFPEYSTRSAQDLNSSSSPQDIIVSCHRIYQNVYTAQLIIAKIQNNDVVPSTVLFVVHLSSC